jgi:hypothetical protein
MSEARGPGTTLDLDRMFCVPMVNKPLTVDRLAELDELRVILVLGLSNRFYELLHGL